MPEIVLVAVSEAEKALFRGTSVILAAHHFARFDEPVRREIFFRHELVIGTAQCPGHRREPGLIRERRHQIALLGKNPLAGFRAHKSLELLIAGIAGQRIDDFEDLDVSSLSAIRRGSRGWP